MASENRKQSKALALRRLSAIPEQYQAILTLLVPLMIYVVLVSWRAYTMRDQINPDAVSYIRNAQYLAEGRFADSVSGYWSPLISWCMAPFLYFGLDGLYTARIVLAIWGGVFVLASSVFVQRFVRCSVWLRLAALSLIAISTVRAATYVITPDLILFTVLMGYFALVVSPKLLEQKRLQVLSGLLAGIAYLAKSYGLPFFLAHFTFIVALQWWVRRSSTSLRRTFFAWGTGVLAFLVVTAPWIGLLSWKYGSPTFSTVARHAHTLSGPAHIADHVSIHGMYDLAPGRIYVNETPELRSSHLHWSPLQKWNYATHQIKLTASNTKGILAEIRSFDVLGFSLPALLLIPIVMAKHGSPVEWFRSVWVLATVLIYSSGFALVYYIPRYIEHLLWPICCIYCLGFFVPLFARLAAKGSLPRWSTLLVSALVVASFAERVRNRDLEYLMDDTVPRGAFYRTVAQELRSAGFTGPFAADELHRYLGAYVAFHLNEPFLGNPLEKTESEIRAGTPIEMTVPEIEATLKEYGAQSFLIHSDSAFVDLFREKTSWQLKQEIPYDPGTLYVYVCPRPTEIQLDESGPGMLQDERNVRE